MQVIAPSILLPLIIAPLPPLFSLPSINVAPNPSRFSSRAYPSRRYRNCPYQSLQLTSSCFSISTPLFFYFFTLFLFRASLSSANFHFPSPCRFIPILFFFCPISTLSIYKAKVLLRNRRMKYALFPLVPRPLDGGITTAFTRVVRRVRF